VPAQEAAEPREARRLDLRGEVAPTIGMSIQCKWLIA